MAGLGVGQSPKRDAFISLVAGACCELVLALDRGMLASIRLCHTFPQGAQASSKRK